MVGILVVISGVVRRGKAFVESEVVLGDEVVVCLMVGFGIGAKYVT